MLKGFTFFEHKNCIDYFLVSDAKRRTKKDAAKLASAAGLPAGDYSTEYVFIRMQAGTVEFKANAGKTIVKIRTANSGIVDILENGDTVIIW